MSYDCQYRYNLEVWGPVVVAVSVVDLDEPSLAWSVDHKGEEWPLADDNLVALWLKQRESFFLNNFILHFHDFQHTFINNTNFNNFLTKTERQLPRIILNLFLTLD